MAKKKTETDRTETTLAQLKANQAALDAAAEAMPAAKQKKKLALGIPPKLMERALDHNSKTHRVSVDLLGGSVAQVSTELINAAIRALARWSGPKGWVGSNADVLQGAPHVLIGLAIYLTELLTRGRNKLPSFSREVASEAANVFTHLGLHNLVRALRIRWQDGKVDSQTLAAVSAERDAALAKLAALGAGQAKK